MKRIFKDFFYDITKLNVLFTLILSICSLKGTASSPEYINLIDSANNLISHNKLDEAELTLKKALRLEPANFTNSLIFSNLGSIYMMKEDYNQAVDYYSLGISLSPSSTTLYNNRAKAFLSLGDIEKTLTDLNKSIELDSLQEYPIQMRGFININRNDTVAALKDFDKLSEINPTNISALLGKAKIAEINFNYNKALDYYQQALELSHDADLKALYIRALISNGKYSDAYLEVKDSIVTYPSEPVFYVLKALLDKLNYQISDCDNAIVMAKKLGADNDLIESIMKLVIQ